MPFPNTDTQFKPGESGNPGGKAKGTVHLSTMIQNMLSADIDPNTIDPKEKGKKEMQAIIATGIKKAKDGDTKWADWLAKYGYGQKFELDQNISGELNVGTAQAELAEEFSKFLKGK